MRRKYESGTCARGEAARLTDPWHIGKRIGDEDGRLTAVCVTPKDRRAAWRAQHWITSAWLFHPIRTLKNRLDSNLRYARGEKISVRALWRDHRAHEAWIIGVDPSASWRKIRHHRKHPLVSEYRPRSWPQYHMVADEVEWDEDDKVGRVVRMHFEDEEGNVIS